MAQVGSYRERLIVDLNDLSARYAEVLDASAIRPHNWDRGFIGFPHFYWAESSPELQVRRMTLLADVKDLETRIRLLFPRATPEVKGILKESFGLLRRWVKRGTGDHSIPRSLDEAKVIAQKSIDDLKSLADFLPDDEWRVRLVVDTNTLVDNPDLTAYASVLGPRYMVHVLPVVLRELDDLKRAGRTTELREAAKKADRRLKGLRNNGDVRSGVRVQGDIYAVFEFIEPQEDGPPSWIDLSVPDDRLVASALLLQSRQPGSNVHVATGDLNLQNKLAAVGLPFVELPDSP